MFIVLSVYMNPILSKVTLAASHINLNHLFLFVFIIGFLPYFTSYPNSLAYSFIIFLGRIGFIVLSVYMNPILSKVTLAASHINLNHLFLFVFIIGFLPYFTSYPNSLAYSFIIFSSLFLIGLAGLPT